MKLSPRTKFKAVWANKQNRHDRMLPQLWWDIKLPNTDEVWAKHSHYHTSQGATPAVIGHQTLKNIEIFKIFKRVRFYLDRLHAFSYICISMLI